MVRILDATLREGEQTPGVCFDPHIKLAVAQLLDEVGVDIIEGGHPAVAPEIKQAVKTLAGKGLRATVSAHSRSTESDLALALECGVGFLGIFYCVSDERLNNVHRKDLDTAVEHITRAIRYAKQRSPGLVVRYTPEDTVRSAFGNVVKASVAAVQAGADIISVADTTGYMIPGTKNNMYRFMQRLQQAFDEAGVHPKLAVHCHNDRGLALANALDAYRAGVDIIDACVLGLGERSGIVDLAQLLTVLKSDFEEGAGWNLAKLPALYELVSTHSGVPIPVTFPIVGENAFTHCAGVHTQAAIQNPLHYQSLDPALVGRKMKISLGHMSGMASIRYALEQAGIRGLDEELERAVLHRVKSIGRTGRAVGASELPYIVEWCRKQAGGDDGNAG